MRRLFLTGRRHGLRGRVMVLGVRIWPGVFSRSHGASGDLVHYYKADASVDLSAKKREYG